MFRFATVLIAAAVAASSLSATPALAHEGWHRGDHAWHGHEWRGQAWRRHEGWEHRRWYPGHYNYGYYHAPHAYYRAPGVTFGFTLR